MDPLPEIAIRIAVNAVHPARDDLAIREQSGTPLEEMLKSEREIHHRAAHECLPRTVMRSSSGGCTAPCLEHLVRGWGARGVPNNPTGDYCARPGGDPDGASPPAP